MLTMNSAESEPSLENQKPLVDIDRNDESQRIEELKLKDFSVISIGVMESMFNRKNGTPRQSSICPQSKGVIRLHKRLFNNPNHAFNGIEHFEYLWILFYFHQNKNKRRFIAKIHPPKLDGFSCGVFASRAPHRPNPFGLTLVKLDSVKNDSLYVSGIDIIDGTPIIDIKPYIDKYDYPFYSPCIDEKKEIQPVDNIESNNTDENQQQIPRETNKTKGWIDGSLVKKIQVAFTPRSLGQLELFHSKSFHGETKDNQIGEKKCQFCFKFFKNNQEAKETIVDLLQADPRSVYRRNKCQDRLYYNIIDAVKVVSWFDYELNLVEIVKIKPLN